MCLIDVDNISFKEINKALKDLSWWCDTNEQDGVVYIPSSNLIKDIGRIKDYLEYIKQQPTAYDVDKVVKHIEECNRIREKDMEKKIDRELRIYYEGQLFIANEIIKLIKRGGIND